MSLTGNKSLIGGPGDSYGHARRIPNVDNYNGRNIRSGAERTFQGRNRPNQYRHVNCAGGEEVGGGQDNRDYDEDESDNSDYPWDHSSGHVLLTENGDNCASRELEIEEMDGRHADSDVDAYLANRSVSGEYRAARRSVGCDVFKTLSRKNLIRRVNGEKERPIQKFEKSLGKSKNKFQIPQKKRNQTNERRNYGGYDRLEWRPN